MKYFFKEPLNKSHAGTKAALGRECAKGDEGNATAEGGAVASEGRCDPVAGCTAQSSISAVVASPTRVVPLAGPSPCASGRYRGGRSSSFRQEVRPRSGMHGPVIHKCGRRIPYAGRSRFTGSSPCASGRYRGGRSSVFPQEDATPQRDARPSHP